MGHDKVYSVGYCGGFFSYNMYLCLFFWFKKLLLMGQFKTVILILQCKSKLSESWKRRSHFGCSVDGWYKDVSAGADFFFKNNGLYLKV